MNKTDYVLVGLGASVVTNVAWNLYPERQKFKLQLYKLTSPEEPEKSPLAFVEHYHWGLVSLCVGRLVPKYSGIFDGFGLGMIASELVEPNPFGIGKTEYEVRGNVILASVLGSVLLLLAFKHP